MLALWQNNSGIIHQSLYYWKGCGLAYEDLEQEAYLAFAIAVRRYLKCGGEWTFSTILTKTIRWYFIRYTHQNKYLSCELTQLNEPAHSSEDDSVENIELIADESDMESDVLDDYSNSEMGLAFKKALVSLRDDQKTALTLKYYKELTTAQTAARMGIEPKQAASLIRNGLRVLRHPKISRHLRHLSQFEDYYVAGLRSTSFSSFKNKQSSSQELYLMWREQQQLLNSYCGGSFTGE